MLAHMSMRPLVLAIALSLIARIAIAQTTDTATAAGWAQTFLSSVSSLDAHFQQDTWVRVQQHTTTSHGRLRIARPARVRLDYEGSSAPIGIANGADYLVIGRPITRAADPVAVLAAINATIGTRP